MFGDLLVSEGRSQTQASLTLKTELLNSWLDRRPPANADGEHKEKPSSLLSWSC